MNASLHSRLELPDQRRAHGLALTLLSGLGLLSVLASGAPTLIGLGLWVLAAAPGGLGLRTLPGAATLSAGSDGGLWWQDPDRREACAVTGVQRYGPWQVLALEGAAERRRRAVLWLSLLSAEQRRSLGRMLAASAPAPAASV
ncbi:hypothetical protein [Pseudomarimonas salicorniae]|uniref:Toxin CptA n=1 Tax=Pseudomarimonas salicorniae TaxID=2933270 RepID=A0ABT0GEH1_9GAMM|nr:hypothetical protein [Lysobacter sp. CAU 1642]MCK7592955.1 hypothetical protein [Lysobacter sp. CAU 1642]